MVTGAVIVGSADSGLIVCTPVPGMLKLMTSTALVVAAGMTSALTGLPWLIERIASRKVTTPSTATVSPVPVTVMRNGGGGGENSEVLPSESVAVAVTRC